MNHKEFEGASEQVVTTAFFNEKIAPVLEFHPAFKKGKELGQVMGLFGHFGHAAFLIFDALLPTAEKLRIIYRQEVELETQIEKLQEELNQLCILKQDYYHSKDSMAERPTNEHKQYCRVKGCGKKCVHSGLAGRMVCIEHGEQDCNCCG